MFMIGPLGFLVPLLLLALVALPVLWLLLRAVPPAPVRRRFPGVALLLGLSDDDQETDKTPWWLLVLRLLAIAAVIVGFAGPVLNPVPERGGNGPLLILIDGTWADARDWSARLNRIEGLLADATQAARPVAVVALTDLPPGELSFQAADSWAARLPGLKPQPWQPDPAALTAWAAALPEGIESFWLSDGVARETRTGLLAALQTRGGVTVFESPRAVYGIRPPKFADGEIAVTVLRAHAAGVAEVTVAAVGLDPAGIERDLASLPLAFEAGATEATGKMSVPPELRNRIARFQLSGVRSAAAVSLADDGLKRREVALISGREDREGLELLSPTHYLRRALSPVADLIDGTIADILLANPDVIILADVARLTQTESDGVADWVDQGGLLVRFAGPRLAASDVSRDVEDPLMPVRLREGGRSVGGAMSWGEPKQLRAFAEGSPFFGLAIPAEVTVRSQVMAQPDPTLAGRTIATLADGTPLVTRKSLGEGAVVLFHVTANAEWTSLPLSGLFVQMLERLAVSTRAAAPTPADLGGTTWVAEKVLDAFGAVQDGGQLAGVPGERLATGAPAPGMAPGVYAEGDRRLALNVIAAGTMLQATVWPDSVVVEGLAVQRETALKGACLVAALLALLIDVLASLWLSGRLRGPRSGGPGTGGERTGGERTGGAKTGGSRTGGFRTGGAMTSGARIGGTVAVLALLLVLPWQGRAQDALPPNDILALEATNNVVLAWVVTGDAEADRVAEAGLRGLSLRLAERTSIEPADPIGVNLETDELTFFPFLYWPVSALQPIPSDEAYARLNRYLRNGGMILFDTRDADVAGFGGSTPTGKKLRDLAAGLDVPALEPLPADHVLTRTFYLLQDAPGRFAGREIWVEAAPPDAEQQQGMPFRNLNDGVTPVVIGGNDWASAWAVDGRGVLMFPVGRGYAGERQREMAYRFGINLIMHVLTGNYKSDQVHVPALLERLGQ